MWTTSTRRSPGSESTARSSSAAKWSSTKTRIGSATSAGPRAFSSGSPKNSAERRAGLLPSFAVAGASYGEACSCQEAAQQIRVATRTDGADLGGGDQLPAAGAAAVGQLAALQVGSQPSTGPTPVRTTAGTPHQSRLG